VEQGPVRQDVTLHMTTSRHLSLGKDAPASRPATPLSTGRIVESPQVNGLHHGLRPARRRRDGSKKAPSFLCHCAS
jgi:hypothetical protein